MKQYKVHIEVHGKVVAENPHEALKKARELQDRLSHGAPPDFFYFGVSGVVQVPTISSVVESPCGDAP